MAMPERVEQQGPGGEAGAFLGGGGEELLYAALETNFADAGLRRHQRSELRAPTRDPFADRDGEAAFLRHRRRGFRMCGEPSPQQVFAEAARDLELVGEAEG